MSEAVAVTPKTQVDYLGVEETAAPASSDVPKWATKFILKNQHARECVAEFFGTLIMILFGMAVNAQVILSEGTKGTFLSINLAWGVAVMLGVHCTAGISGADLNPAVTFAKCVHGLLPWWKFPGYFVSQTLGAFVGACLIYLLHKPNLDNTELPETVTRTIFSTYPGPHISNLNGFYTELLGTAMLTVGVFSMNDQRNRPVSPWASPVHFCLVIAAIGMAFGMNTGYAINPARDLGPRTATWVCGWGTQVWTAYHHYFWIPIVAPCVGGALGGYMYKIFISMHEAPEQPQNLPK